MTIYLYCSDLYFSAGENCYLTSLTANIGIYNKIRTINNMCNQIQTINNVIKNKEEEYKTKILSYEKKKKQINDDCNQIKDHLNKTKKAEELVDSSEKSIKKNFRNEKTLIHSILQTIDKYNEVILNLEDEIKKDTEEYFKNMSFLKKKKNLCIEQLISLCPIEFNTTSQENNEIIREISILNRNYEPITQKFSSLEKDLDFQINSSIIRNKKKFSKKFKTNYIDIYGNVDEKLISKKISHDKFANSLRGQVSGKIHNLILLIKRHNEKLQIKRGLLEKKINMNLESNLQSALDINFLKHSILQEEKYIELRQIELKRLKEQRDTDPQTKKKDKPDEREGQLLSRISHTSFQKRKLEKKFLKLHAKLSEQNEKLEDLTEILKDLIEKKKKRKFENKKKQVLQDIDDIKVRIKLVQINIEKYKERETELKIQKNEYTANYNSREIQIKNIDIINTLVNNSEEEFDTTKDQIKIDTKYKMKVDIIPGKIETIELNYQNKEGKSDKSDEKEPHMNKIEFISKKVKRE